MGQLEFETQPKNIAGRMAALIVGDFLVIFLFIFIGRVSHSFANNTLLTNLMSAAPFLIGWFAIAPWFGLFRAEISRNWRQLVPRLLIAWAIGGVLSHLVRSLMLGRPLVGGIIPVFALITIVGTAIFLLIWRLAYAWWARRRMV